MNVKSMCLWCVSIYDRIAIGDETMDKKFDDLMNSVFGAKKTLDKLDKKQKSSSLVNELDQMSKEMDKLIKSNKETIIKEASKDMENLQNALKEEKQVIPFEFSTFQQQLQSILVGQDEFIHQLTIAFKRPTIAGYKMGKIKNNILILGNPGTGKQSTLEKANELLYIAGITSSKTIQLFDLSLYPSQGEEKLFLQDLFSALSKPNTVITFVHFEECYIGYLTMLTQLLSQGKVQLNKRYIINNHQLVENNNVLASDSVGSIEANDHYMVFISSMEKNKLTAKMGSKFMQLFSDICETSSFSDEEIYEFIEKQRVEFLNENETRLSLKIGLPDNFNQLIFSYYQPRLGIDSIEFPFQQLKLALIELKLQSIEPISQIDILADMAILANQKTYSMSSLLPLPNNLEYQEVMDELDEVIGLKEVKEYILSLKDHFEMAKRRELQGLKSSAISKHMIFTGNPGTGKTTIARIVSRYLKAIGLLENGQLVEVSRGDLVGRYVGHTAPLTRQVIESAIGGVLFIDEAYSLYRGKEDSFGLEAIDTLVKGMEDHRDQLVVILAGYTKEMADFLESNSGLKSRFPNIIEFKDYDAKELLDISINIALSKDYYIDESCYEALMSYYDHKQKTDSRNSGNGRMARNLIEQAMINQAKRLIVENDLPLNQLILSDFDLN